MFTPAIWIIFIQSFNWGSSLADYSWENISAINVTVFDYVFCQQKQIKATFCIHCGSDFPDAVAVSIVKGENDTDRGYQMLCVPPKWVCVGPRTATYNTTSDTLEINFIFNLTVNAGHYLRIIHERNGSQEYQQIPLKQYKHSKVNRIVIDVVFCQQEQTKATFCIYCGSLFQPVFVPEVQNKVAYKVSYQMFTYNPRNNTLEINFTPNFIVLKGQFIRIIHGRIHNQEYQQILLKPNSHIEASYLEPYCALSCPRNATKQRCTLPAGSCQHHVHRSQTYNTECIHGYYGKKCKKRCSENCYVTSRCNGVTGQCNRGCKPGWTTTTCKQKCPTGTFGPDCRQDCGHCFEEDQCHFINGSCLNGCSSGYKGDRCIYKCSTGYFGSNCSNKCSAYCRGNSSCNHITGVCNEGCKAGWFGDLCGSTVGDLSNGITPILAGFVLQVAVLWCCYMCILVIL